MVGSKWWQNSLEQTLLTDWHREDNNEVTNKIASRGASEVRAQKNNGKAAMDGEAGEELVGLGWHPAPDKWCLGVFGTRLMGKGVTENDGTQPLGQNKAQS